MLSSRRLLKSLLSLLPKLLCLLLFSCCTQFAHAQYYIFRQDTTINAGDPTYENLNIPNPKYVCPKIQQVWNDKGINDEM